jgi:hypothetical protein
MGNIFYSRKKNLNITTINTNSKHGLKACLGHVLSVILMAIQ